jgi:hypothetical protein
VDTGTANAHKDADVPGCPSRVLVALAVSACLVGFQLDQLLERGQVLRRAVDRSSRHDEYVLVARIRLGGVIRNRSRINKKARSIGCRTWLRGPLGLDGPVRRLHNLPIVLRYKVPSPSITTYPSCDIVTLHS